jgi:hypothetical protein
MCGVVLWSCEDDGRAVIWCEDHGKLAFYSEGRSPRPASDMHVGVPLDAGDLIEFDVEDEEHQRRAHNPRLLVSDHAPCIATELRERAADEPGGAGAQACDAPANVVSFPGAPGSRGGARAAGR